MLFNRALLRAKAHKNAAKLLHVAAFLASPARFERTAFRLGGDQIVFASLHAELSDAGESIHY